MGKLQGVMNAAVISIVVLVVLFQSYAAIMPSAQAAGSLMNDSNRCVSAVNASGNPCTYDPTTAACWDSPANDTACSGVSPQIPLGQLFNGTGVVFVIVMAALLVVAIRGFMAKGK